MSDFSLTIQFTSADAHQINGAGQQVTIVKQVGGGASNSDSGTKVAWVVFDSF